MVNKESDNIYSFGFSSMIFTLIKAVFFGLGTYIMFNISKGDIVTSSIFGFLVSFLYFGVIYYIVSKNEYKDIFELNEAMFGKVFGTAINYYLGFAYFAIASIILYNLSNFINIEYLNTSNLNYIKSLLLVPVIYASTKKLSSLIKMNQIFAFITFSIIIFSLLGIFGRFEIFNVEPLFTAGVKSITHSTLVYFSCIVVALSILPIVSIKTIIDKVNLKSNMLGAFIITNITQIVIIVFTLIALGIEFILIFRYPEYVSLKQFELFKIFERVENILALRYLFNAFCLLSFIYYYILRIFSVNRKKETGSYILSFVLVVITALIFGYNSLFIDFIMKYLVWINMIGIFLPMMLIFIRMLYYNKRKTNLSIKM